MQVAAFLLENGLAGSEGVVFVNDSGEKVVYTRDTRVVPVSQSGLPKHARFAFYDQVILGRLDT